MPTRKVIPKPAIRKSDSPPPVRGKVAVQLPVAMTTGKASPAKAAVGDKPVFAYIASLPQPQRGGRAFISLRAHFDQLAPSALGKLRALRA